VEIPFAFLVGLFVTFFDPGPDALERVRSGGELRVLTRESPASYYLRSDGPAGFEYDLVRRFAGHLGVKLRVLTAPTRAAILAGVRRGHAHLAAAAIAVTPARRREVRFGPAYQEIREQVVYRAGRARPDDASDLAEGTLRVVAGSTHARTLAALAEAAPGLAWREEAGATTEEHLRSVWAGVLDYTIADSIELTLLRYRYPELRVAFELGEPRDVAWAFPRGGGHDLYLEALAFFDRMRRSGELERLVERHFGHADRFDYVDARKLLRHIDERLPHLEPHFRAAAEKQGLDWHLLAAMGYQESHWDPEATSPTGVRGIMMLTEDTAAQMGVADRLDPAQSIRGGARYLARVKEKLPERIPEPDRSWLALAAYNVGFGHLEDARVLTERGGGDPDRWTDVRRYLPLLAKKKHHAGTKHGFARGGQAVRFVENIRRYHDVLVWAQDEHPEGEQPPETELALPDLYPLEE